MIKVENIEVFNFEGALRGMRAKGYRKNKNGKYETFASRNGKSVNLGTYKKVYEKNMWYTLAVISIICMEKK